MMATGDIQALIEEAIFDFTSGNNSEAIEKLVQATKQAPMIFAGWHALAEVYFSEKDYQQALIAAERAYAIDPIDIHINTSLSRIWMELGDKRKAEHFGVQARRLSWKEQLEEAPPVL